MSLPSIGRRLASTDGGWCNSGFGDTSLHQSWSGVLTDQQLIADESPIDLMANSVVQGGSIALPPSSGRDSAVGMSSALSDQAIGTNGLPVGSNLLEQSSVIVEHDANAASDHRR